MTERDGDGHLHALVHYQATQIDRLAQADTFALTAARMRIVELEEIILRLNKAKPRAADGSIVDELARIDPRTTDLECFFCFQSDGHRWDCIWDHARRRADHNRKQAAS